MRVESGNNHHDATGVVVRMPRSEEEFRAFHAIECRLVHEHAPRTNHAASGVETLKRASRDGRPGSRIATMRRRPEFGRRAQFSVVEANAVDATSPNAPRRGPMTVRQLCQILT